jgi:hypothetical protein
MQGLPCTRHRSSLTMPSGWWMTPKRNYRQPNRSLARLLPEPFPDSLATVGGTHQLWPRLRGLPATAILYGALPGLARDGGRCAQTIALAWVEGEGAASRRHTARSHSRTTDIMGQREYTRRAAAASMTSTRTSTRQREGTQVQDEAVAAAVRVGRGAQLTPREAGRHLLVPYAGGGEEDDRALLPSLAAAAAAAAPHLVPHV